MAFLREVAHLKIEKSAVSIFSLFFLFIYDILVKLLMMQGLPSQLFHNPVSEGFS